MAQTSDGPAFRQAHSRGNLEGLSVDREMGVCFQTNNVEGIALVGNVLQLPLLVKKSDAASRNKLSVAMKIFLDCGTSNCPLSIPRQPHYLLFK